MTSTAASSPQAFRRSLSDRIKQEARAGGRSSQQLQRQFLMQRFLARVFADPSGRWILKGGTGLLIRLPGARHSQDIDLLHNDSDVFTAVEELRRLAATPAGDPLTFVMGQPEAMTGGVSGMRVPVEAYLAAIRFERFTIDLSTELHTVGRLERTQPVPIIDMPGLPQLPQFVLYPLPDQVADKICAMYERHGNQDRPSTRYRDLVDLLLIVTSLPLDAAHTLSALASESSRRSLQLPTELTEPGPEWTRGYREIARSSTLNPELHDMRTALTRAGACLNPLLGRQITTGVWNPADGIWGA